MHTCYTQCEIAVCMDCTQRIPGEKWLWPTRMSVEVLYKKHWTVAFEGFFIQKTKEDWQQVIKSKGQNTSAKDDNSSGV